MSWFLKLVSLLEIKSAISPNVQLDLADKPVYVALLQRSNTPSTPEAGRWRCTKNGINVQVLLCTFLQHKSEGKDLNRENEWLDPTDIAFLVDSQDELDAIADDSITACAKAWGEIIAVYLQGASPEHATLID